MWADESRHSKSTSKVRIGGFGGDSQNWMFEQVMAPAIRDLVASLNTSGLAAGTVD